MMILMWSLFVRGSPVQVYRINNASQVGKIPSGCNALFLSKYDETDEKLVSLLPEFDVIFTDAADVIPFGEVQYPLAYLEETTYRDELRFRSTEKEGKRTLSFLVPPLEDVEGDDYLRQLVEDAWRTFPDDVFIDSGPEQRHRAFSSYAFSVLLSARTSHHRR